MDGMQLTLREAVSNLDTKRKYIFCRGIKPDLLKDQSQAIASFEAYGVFVYELAQKCGMNYINGKNTVTYFGVFLYSVMANGSQLDLTRA